MRAPNVLDIYSRRHIGFIGLRLEDSVYDVRCRMFVAAATIIATQQIECMVCSVVQAVQQIDNISTSWRLSFNGYG